MLNIHVPPSELPEHLISEGRYWATTEDLTEITGQRGAVLRVSLARLVKKGRLFSPARGFYVMVPPEYRAWGVIPADWFIDAMMRHLERPYYVGFLSAAAIHGASHQAPLTFQIVTTKPLHERAVRRLHLRFIVFSHATDMATQRHMVPTGYAVVASRETTIVDLAWRPRLGGGISNVATVLKEIGDLDGEWLARLAPHHGRSTARRLGWLLDAYRPDVDTHWLRQVAAPEHGEPAFLAPGGPRRGHRDKVWNLILNTVAEPDV